MSEPSPTRVREPVDRGTSVPVRPGARSKPTPADIGDSPWLWLLLFAAFGMFGMFAIGSKYQSRQTAIEREYQGIRTMQQKEAREVLGTDDLGNTSEPPTVDGTEHSMIITLRPLFLVLGVFAICGWLVLLWRGSMGGKPPEPNPRTDSPQRPPETEG